MKLKTLLNAHHFATLRLVPISLDYQRRNRQVAAFEKGIERKVNRKQQRILAYLELRINKYNATNIHEGMVIRDKGANTIVSIIFELVTIFKYIEEMDFE